MSVSMVTATVSLGSLTVKCGGALPVSTRLVSQDRDFSKDVLHPPAMRCPQPCTPHTGQANEGRLMRIEHTHTCTLESGLQKPPPCTQRTRPRRHLQEEPAVRLLCKLTVLALLGPPPASHQGQTLPDRHACSSRMALGKLRHLSEP